MGIELIRSRALQALRPPADLPLAEWIERNIFLPQTASALPGKMKLWAYQRGICDALDDPGIERVSAFAIPCSKGFCGAKAAVPATRLPTIPRWNSSGRAFSWRCLIVGCRRPNWRWSATC